jgi:hypothetical protein
VAPGNDVQIAASASDPDGDALVYSWTADAGGFSDDASTSTVWTAPAENGSYALFVSATDAKGASATLGFTVEVQTDVGSGRADVLIEINTWPEVKGLVPSPTRIDVGETTFLTLTIADPDGDGLGFSWTASCTGTFNDASAQSPSFTLDVDNGDADCTLSAEIDDGRGGKNQASIAIETGPGISTDTDSDTDTGADTDTGIDAARAVINEIAAAVGEGCDLVELRIVEGGTMAGMELRERASLVVAFGDLIVETDDIVVVHFDAEDTVNCNPQSAQSELLSKNEYPASLYPGNLDSAWDAYVKDTGLTATTNVLTLYDDAGEIMDAVLLSDKSTGTAAADSEAQAAVIAAAFEWTAPDGSVPPGGFVDNDFCANAANGLAASNLTTSVQRLRNLDANLKDDWTSAASSWGTINAGQLPL